MMSTIPYSHLLRAELECPHKEDVGEKSGARGEEETCRGTGCFRT